MNLVSKPAQPISARFISAQIAWINHQLIFQEQKFMPQHWKMDVGQLLQYYHNTLMQEDTRKYVDSARMDRFCIISYKRTISLLFVQTHSVNYLVQCTKAFSQ